MSIEKPLLQQQDEDLDYPPTLEGEINRLRNELDNFRHDNIYKLFFSVNRKAGEIADTLNETVLKLSGDDKAFDRFLKLIDKLEPFVKTLATLRQDYLKVPEDELESLEKNGAPPIERIHKKPAKSRSHV